ncbi:MAG: hypothetical protein LUP97_09005 [Methanoregula sp.]|jgi:hypothetical protein|nr:hypothetical protein [Methanoregula sp.]WML67773.1 MAG: hypothetical protein METHP_01332 [Methanoregula sp. SKADARSKE-2]
MGKVISEGDDLKRMTRKRYDRTLRGFPISETFGIFEADYKERAIKIVIKKEEGHNDRQKIPHPLFRGVRTPESAYLVLISSSLSLRVAS